MSALRLLFTLPRDLVELGFSAVAYLTSRITSGSHKMPAELTPIEDISQLSPLVKRVLGKNPGPFTLQGTNTYLVGAGKQKVLIDTGEPNVREYLSNLVNALGDAEIAAIIATHWHIDHVGGVDQITKHFPKKQIPVFKHRRMDGSPESNCVYEFVENNHEIRVDGATLRLIYAPGHTSDHCVVWLKEERALFSGDCVLGEGTAIFENLRTYMASLRHLLELNPSRIYPGHGPVIEDPRRKVDEYIAHRQQREREIVELITQRGPMTAMQVTSSLYSDILWARKMGALHNVQHHLRKLVEDGAIVDIGPSVAGMGFGVYRLANERERSNI